VLAAATILRKSKEASLESVNQTVRSIVEMRVTQWSVLINPAQEFSEYRFGDFVYGVLDTDLLRQRSERVGCNYAKLYVDGLRGRLAVCRDGHKIRVVNLKPLLKTIEAKYVRSLLYRVLDVYFGVLSDCEQRHFLVELDRCQAIYGANGLGTFRADSLKDPRMHNTWITIFDAEKRNQGWVVPSQAYPIFTATDPRVLADRHAQINVGLRLLDWGSRALDDILQVYSEYLSTARNYEDVGRTEEALLHLVFALDLLLGGEAGDSLTAVLADRVAMLSHLALKQDYHEVGRFVRDTYDMRSGYVHRGQRGKLSESTRETLIVRLGRLNGITRAVLGAACFARSQPWCEVREARKVWLGRIDILRKKLEIGQGLDPIDVQQLGLDRIELGQVTPAYVSIKWAE
jgi:hypothetical protein